MGVARSTARNVVLTRVFVVALGSAAVIWGLVTLPIFWQQAALERIAQSITRGEAYSHDALGRMLRLVETTEKATFCDPTALRDAAIIRLRIAEIGRTEEAKEKPDADINLATDSVVRALSCSPADSFLWLGLYWLKTAQHGFGQEDLKYLKLSYQLGPNEGWIASKRNAFTFAMLQELPMELQAQTGASSKCDENSCKLFDFSQTAVNEFVGLLKSELYNEAAAVFKGPAWSHRELILQHLAGISELHRRRFANALREGGMNESDIMARLISEPGGTAGGITREPSSQPLKIP